MQSIPERLIRAKWFPPVLAAVAVSVVVLLFAWPTILAGRTLFNTHAEYPPSDETAVHFPIHNEVRRQMDHGHLPLFNPWPAFGIPLAADPNALVFDPIMFFLRSAGPDSVVLSIRSILMAAVGAMSLFGFLWMTGVPLAGAVAGGVVYSSLVLRYPTAEELLIHYVATDWSVLGLFLLAYAIRARKSWAFPLAGIATGFAALSGHPQGVYFGLGLSLLYLVGEAWPRRGGQTRRVVTGGLGWLTVTMAVAAAQIVPLAARAAISSHVFDNPAHPEFDENLFGYATSLLGPGLFLLFLLPLRRRWLEIWTFILTGLFILTILNTPIMKLWHFVLPFFDNFRLSSKYFISPFPILASVGLGLAIGFVSTWKGWPGRIGIFVCGICALWPLWTAPFATIYRLQQPVAQVEALDQACVDDIRRATPPMGRIMRFGTEALYPSLPVTARIFDVHVAAGILPQRYVRLMDVLNPERGETLREDSRLRGFVNPAVLNKAFWDVAGVTTVVSGTMLDIPGLELVTSRPDRKCMTDQTGYYVYKRTGAYDRAFLVADPGTSDGQEMGLGFVTDPDTVAPELLPGSVTIREYSGDVIVVDVNASAPGSLVLTDFFGKGWEATVDGESVGINRAWYLFRSVKVPQGSHVVRFRYRPIPMFFGITASAAGLLGALVWFVTAAFVLPSARRKPRGQCSEGIRGSGQQGT